MNKAQIVLNLFENSNNDSQEMYEMIFHLLSTGHAVFKKDTLINTGKYNNSVNNTSGKYVTDDTANEYIKNFNKIYGSQKDFVDLHNKYFRYGDDSKKYWLSDFKKNNILEKKEKSNFQSDQSPKIDEQKIKQLYSQKVNQDYPQAFDKTFTVKDVKGDMNKEELMFVVIGKDGKERISKPLKVVGVSKKAIGLSDPNQSDQLRSYIPKVQMLVRGAFKDKDKDKTVIIAESPEWVLKNVSNKGIITEKFDFDKYSPKFIQKLMSKVSNIIVNFNRNVKNNPFKFDVRYEISKYDPSLDIYDPQFNLYIWFPNKNGKYELIYTLNDVDEKNITLKFLKDTTDDLLIDLKDIGLY